MEFAMWTVIECVHLLSDMLLVVLISIKIWSFAPMTGNNTPSSTP
jgi:hypothetical protein